MNTVHRRTEIINILIIRRHTTANELAQEFGVSIRTIQYDIQALTPVYPIYTKQGENGGIFIREDYKPYANSLTPMEVAALHELYDWTEGIHKKVLFQVLRKYGPDKLQSKFHANFKNASKFAILMYFRRNPSSCFYILTFIAPPFQQNHF